MNKKAALRLNEERELAVRMRQGDAYAREQLIAAHLDYVWGLVPNYYKKSKSASHQELEDVYQAGVVGLLDAVECFDPTKGARLSTWAYFYIMHEIYEYEQAKYSAPVMLSLESTGLKEADENQVPLKELIPALSTDPYWFVRRMEIIEELGHVLGQLDERAQDIIIQRYFAIHPTPLRELAEKYNVSTAAIAKAENKALETMKNILSARKGFEAIANIDAGIAIGDDFYNGDDFDESYYADYIDGLVGLDDFDNVSAPDFNLENAMPLAA